MSDESKPAAAYVPWLTFKNAIEQLSKGLPSRLDRSVFPGIAWSAQTQLFAAFRFLGLLSSGEEPTPSLAGLVRGSEEERKEKLRKVVEEAYSELIAIDLTKATKAHLEEKLGTLYSVAGDTRIKAVRFFLSAAVYVGLPLSPFILPVANGSTNGAKRRRSPPRPRPAMKKAPEGGVDTSGKGEALKPNGTSRSVSLLSGGTLTLSATLDLFSLNPADRKFVFDLIDKLEAYEGEGKK